MNDGNTELKSDLTSLRIDRDAARRKRRWPALLVALAVLASAGFYAVRAKRLAGIEVQTAQASVQNAGEANSGTPILTASGYVVARRKAVVSAKIQGRLSELKVEEGSHVQEGDIIARLESADYLAQVARARASVQHAEADLAENKRQLGISQKLNEAKVSSQDQLDAARSRVRLAEAALAQARAELEINEASYANTLIKAPFTGVVVKKMAEVGESVAPIPPGVNISTSSGAIVALADFSTLEVEADVSESNVAKLRPNQPAEVTVEAFPDRKYRAVLRQVIPTADRTKATVQVKVTILVKDKDLKPEMSAKATFLEAEKAVSARERKLPAPTISVPREAVATRDGKPVVFEVQQGQVRQLPVVTGAEDRGQVLVKHGLAGSENLVLNPPDTLHDGDRVRVKG